MPGRASSRPGPPRGPGLGRCSGRARRAGPRRRGRPMPGPGPGATTRLRRASTPAPGPIQAAATAGSWPSAARSARARLLVGVRRDGRRGPQQRADLPLPQDDGHRPGQVEHQVVRPLVPGDGGSRAAPRPAPAGPAGPTGPGSRRWRTPASPAGPGGRPSSTRAMSAPLSAASPPPRRGPGRHGCRRRPAPGPGAGRPAPRAAGRGRRRPPRAPRRAPGRPAPVSPANPGSGMRRDGCGTGCGDGAYVVRARRWR